MAKDKSKKGFRKTPEQWVEFLINTYGYEATKQYVKDTGRGKSHASKQRIDLSEAFEKVGSVHEGHFAAAKDQDFKRKLGGGPSSGRGLRPELGYLNVAHGEKPRISVSEMERLGFPTNWVSDFYEWDLERLGMKVIGNLDAQGAMDVDAGMPIGQAEAQSRLRDDLRRQGVDIPGARPTYPEPEGKPLKFEIPETQVIPPEFDASDIYQTGEVAVRPRTGPVPKVPAQPVPFVELKAESGQMRTFVRRVPGGVEDVIFDAGELRKAQKLAKTVSGAAGEIPFAGYVAGPLLGYALGMPPGEAVVSNLPGVSDIEGNELAVRERVPGTTDMFVDPRTNRVDPRTIEEAQSGPLGLAYKDGKPIAVPYGSVAGTTDFMETIKQAGQQILDVNEARARRFFGNGAVDFTKGAAQLFFGI